MQIRVVAALLVGAALTVAGCGSSTPVPPPAAAPVSFSITTTTPTSTTATPTRMPYLGPDGLPMETGRFLASALTTRLGGIVNGIQCQTIGQLAYTAYAHLQVYVDGRSRALPGGIGLVAPSPQVTQQGLLYYPSACMYWLHTRASDGLLEVQSPVPRTFTLGDFFRIWDQPLGTDRVCDQRGPVAVFVNGRRWQGDPSAIPLAEHDAIELAVGRPVPPPEPVDWAGSGL